MLWQYFKDERDINPVDNKITDFTADNTINDSFKIK